MIRIISYLLISLSTLMSVGIVASPLEVIKNQRTAKKNHKNKKSENEKSEENEEEKELEESIEKELEWVKLGYKLHSLSLSAIVSVLSKRNRFFLSALSKVYLSIPTPPPERV